MKCTISKKDLTRMLARCKGATDAKNPAVTAHCVLLRAEGDMLSVFATKLDLSMYTESQCAVETKGEAVVDMEKFRNAVTAMPDGLITIKADTEKFSTIVSCSARRKYTIHGLNPRDYPAREMPPQKLEWYTLTSKLSQEAVERTKRSASTEQGREYMNGILFEFGPKHFGAVATNGYTMSCFSHSDAFDHPEGACFMPNATLPMLLSSTEDVRIAYTDRAVFVHSGSDRLSALLPLSVFPNWRIIREGCKVHVACKFDVPQLIAAVRAVTAITKATVKLHLSRGTLHLSLVDVPDSEGEDALAVSADDNETFTMGVNPEHLLNVLEGCQAGIAELMHDPNDPVQPISLNGDDGFFGLVLPVRLPARV